VVVHPLANGGRVILVADTTQATQVRRDLRELMLTAGLFTLAVAGLLLVSVAGRALRPLERLTGLARDITTGDRGRRLVPDRPETDLGRAAAAFDGMLDALETAEQSATAAARDARSSARKARLAADQARRAEAETRRFLADPAHELRTPLAGIQTATERLTAHEPVAPPTAAPAASPTGPDDSARRQRRLQLLLGETRRASRLVRDMLDLSRIDAGVNLEIGDADLGVIAEAEVDRAAMLAPSLTVTRTGVDRVPIRADPARLSQVLSNLLDNARRHTPAGGTVTVDVTVNADIATLTVTDTGPGIADADRARVFDRLVRLDQARHRDHGGAGLGLPITRALAEAHGGTLLCALHDAGARFELRLPVPVAPSAPGTT
jgi:signal transduction histidine kinase